MKHKLLKGARFSSKYLPLFISSVLLTGWANSVSAQCTTGHVFLPSWKAGEYSKITGRKNNLDRKSWGAANKKLTRMMDADTSRNLESGDLPNPRHISNIVSNQNKNTSNAKGLSDMFWLWGQFLDHDITLIHTDEGKPADIPVPEKDPVYEGIINSLPFNRSKLTNNNRHALNSITSYIDGSNIYGSDNQTSIKLRSLQGGKMRMENGLLPKHDGFFLAGDERANEHFGLTAMHTLWVREHNRIADAIACKHPRWKDKKIYKEARRIVIAKLQSITYNEFLPALLGPNALPDYWEDISGYNGGMQANISNVFAAGAYRFGHSMLSPTLLRLNEYGEELELEDEYGTKIDGNVRLRDAFFQPKKVEEAGITPIMRGFASQVAQAADPMIVDDVRNFLFQVPGITQGFDLAALNIQRGRDHELPSYNDVRESLGLQRINSFKHRIWREDFRDRLQQAYTHTDEIDLWVGGLSEKAHRKALVGRTLKAIFIEQFKRLRHGDRFWYENEGQFSYDDIQKLNEITLADVIKQNTSIIHIQDNIFIAKEVHDPVAHPAKRRSPAQSRVRLRLERVDKKRRSHIRRAFR